MQVPSHTCSFNEHALHKKNAYSSHMHSEFTSHILKGEGGIIKGVAQMKVLSQAHNNMEDKLNFLRKTPVSLYSNNEWQVCQQLCYMCGIKNLIIPFSETRKPCMTWPQQLLQHWFNLTILQQSDINKIMWKLSTDRLLHSRNSAT